MKVPLKSLHFDGNTLEFYPQVNIYNLLIQLNKQYHIKDLLNSFYFYGNTLRFPLYT